jgi:hypothetical protein
MGHENPETTLKHYIIQRLKDQAQAQANLARIMGLEEGEGHEGGQETPAPATGAVGVDD